MTTRPGDLRELAPRRLAVLRALQLGDVLCAVPAFRALRTALPNTEIVLVGLPWAHHFTGRYRALFDGFRALPGWPGLPEQPVRPEVLPGFLSDIQSEGFDLVLQMHGSGGVTNPLAVLLGGKRTAGFFAPGAFCPDPALFVPYPEDVHEIRRPLRLLEALGIPLCGEYLEFPVTAADTERLHNVPGVRELPTNGYVCVHPGARAAERRWPIECFASVADRLAAAGLRVVLTGSAEEKALTTRLARTMHAPALDLAGATDLGSLAALLRGARLLLSNNTGVAHLAAALHTPSVVLFHEPAEVGRWAALDVVRHRAVCDFSERAVDTVLDQSLSLLALPASSWLVELAGAALTETSVLAH